jgi:hypothetical protein
MSDRELFGLVVLIAFVVYLCHNHWVVERDAEKEGIEEWKGMLRENEENERMNPLTQDQEKQVDEYFGKNPRTNNKRGKSPTVERRDRDRPAVTEIVSGATSSNVSKAVSSGEAGTLHSQRVTAADKRSGIIRFPKQAKILFPDAKSEVEVLLLGATVRGSYDPRTGPDRERSAVLRVGKNVLGSVRTNERLTVSRGASGTVCLE